MMTALQALRFERELSEKGGMPSEPRAARWGGSECPTVQPGGQHAAEPGTPSPTS